MKIELTLDDQTAIRVALLEYIQHDLPLRRQADARLRIRSRIALIRKITVADHNSRTSFTKVKSFQELRVIRMRGRQWIASHLRARTKSSPSFGVSDSLTTIHGPGPKSVHLVNTFETAAA
jgi:hypothetical protein